MPSKIYPKNIIEQFDVELCRLEEKVYKLNNARSFFPTYDRTHLPHDVLEAEAFNTTQGEFCVRMGNVIYCMPAMGVDIGTIPTILSALLAAGPTGSENWVRVYANALDFTGFANFVPPPSDTSISWRYAGVSWLPNQVGTLRHWVSGTRSLLETNITPLSSPTVLYDVTLETGANADMAGQQPDGGVRIAVIHTSDPGDPWPEYTPPGASTDYYHTDQSIKIYNPADDSYITAFTKDFPNAGLNPIFVTGSWSYDGSKFIFGCYDNWDFARFGPGYEAANYPLGLPISFYVCDRSGDTTFIGTLDVLDDTGELRGIAQFGFRWSGASNEFIWLQIDGTDSLSVRSNVNGIIWTGATSKWPSFAFEISPDGTKLAVALIVGIDYSYQYAHQLYIMNIDGSGLRRLNDYRFHSWNWALDVDANSVSLDWSPDGQYIAVLEGRSAGIAFEDTSCWQQMRMVTVATGQISNPINIYGTGNLRFGEWYRRTSGRFV